VAIGHASHAEDGVLQLGQQLLAEIHLALQFVLGAGRGTSHHVLRAAVIQHGLTDRVEHPVDLLGGDLERRGSPHRFVAGRRSQCRLAALAFEYITAQAGARRAQNVLGVQACLAGGAQLITRESLEAVGGVVDTTTLAEDTVTMFRIQLAGKRVVFEPHAIVWAEEPREVVGLWNQRIRWARGNVQVTLLFRRVWLNRRSGRRLGGVSFALIWFSTTLMPLFMIGSSTGLIGLYAINPPLARHAFVVLWGINALAYAFITASSFCVDPETARWTWREGLAFPGAVSLLIMLHSVAPQLFVVDGAALLRDVGIVSSAALGTALVLFTYLWLSLSMLAAGRLRPRATRARPPTGRSRRSNRTSRPRAESRPAESARPVGRPSAAAARSLACPR
jgi:hypothetical protein